MNQVAEPAASADSNQPLLLALLGDRASNRMRQMLSLYFMVGTAWKIGLKWRERVRAETTFTVAITGSDDLYPDVHDWLLEKLPSHRRRSLVARSSRSGSPTAIPDGASPKSVFQLYYDGDRHQKVQLDGHEIEVHVERVELPRRGGSEGDDGSWLAMAKRIVFTTRNVDGREAVLRFLAEVAARQELREPRLFVASGWGGWNRRSETPTRSLGSVILRAGQKEALVKDLGEFLQMETAYAQLGLPWHRGYLFYGPPGTGKTSVAKALASHFRLDVHYVPLPSVATDTALLELLSGVDARTLLLLEDIDVVNATHHRDRSDNNPGVTLGGLLNALDGFATPHGLITVMTTNDRSVLDKALVRPGRVDRHVEFPLLDDDQLGRLASTFLGRPVDLPTLAGPLSPAEALEAVKSNIGDEEGAIAALKALLV